MVDKDHIEPRPDELTADEAIALVLKRPEMYGLQKVSAVPDAALAAVERVRAIHLPVALETKTVCNSCAEEWPCDTREALDGAPEPTNHNQRRKK